MEEHKPFVEAGLERRKYERVRLYLPGLLLDPLNDQTYECKILNLSASGAGIQCAYTFRLGQLLLLQTDNFGRFEGKVSRCVGETLGFCLIMEAKQGRLIEMLGALAKGSTAGFNKRRKYQRICSLASGSFVRESGKYVAMALLCELRSVLPSVKSSIWEGLAGGSCVITIKELRCNMSAPPRATAHRVPARRL
jgi:hypothetical protein